MATDTDPYRVLGLGRGASLDEVKRAYRRLAKANHPDAAGEAALPRFLAIQAAYDQIVGPGAGATDGPGATGRRARPYRPWEADPVRADATRRAYTGRSRRTRPAGGSRPGAAEAGAGTGAAGFGEAAPGEPSPDAPPRPPKKATLGSTSYDGADTGPFEPDWGGASWYGTTSGTYWTLNPKEYADPRKHGPEYQARARRAAAAAAAGAPPPEDAEATSASSASSSTAARDDPATSTATTGEPIGTEPDAAPPGPTHTTTSWWQDTAADPATAADEDSFAEPRRPGQAGGAPGQAGPAEADVADDTPPADPTPATSPWDPAAWLASGWGGLPARVGRAVIGWAPIALGIGWLAGEITGCARFAAGCDAAAAPVAWFAQLVVLAVLLIVPRFAVAASIAAIATLVAAIPGAVLLSSIGGANDAPTARVALGGLLVIGWVIGLAIGIDREVRRLRPVS